MKQRIDVLDLLRSLWVFVMILWHACYDLSIFGVLSEDAMQRPLPMLICWVGAGSFILISGAAARFSRSSLRRGFFVFCAGALVTLVTTLIGYPVAFGVLQLLGVCMMLYGAVKDRLEPRLGWPLAAVAAVLFAGTWVLTERVSVSLRWLYPLGLKYPGFFSTDYFPLLPWTFLFLLGVCLGKWIERYREHPAFTRRFPPPLTFLGRHSLAVYLIHQPVLYGACLLLRALGAF